MFFFFFLMLAYSYAVTTPLFVHHINLDRLGISYISKSTWIYFVANRYLSSLRHVMQKTPSYRRLNKMFCLSPFCHFKWIHWLKTSAENDKDTRQPGLTFCLVVWWFYLHVKSQHIVFYSDLLPYFGNQAASNCINCAYPLVWTPAVNDFFSCLRSTDRDTHRTIWAAISGSVFPCKCVITTLTDNLSPPPARAHPQHPHVIDEFCV